MTDLVDQLRAERDDLKREIDNSRTHIAMMLSEKQLDEIGLTGRVFHMQVLRLADAYQHASTQLTQLRAEVATLRAKVAELEAFLEREGYRRCDIPACNCNSWHNGVYPVRLREEMAMNTALLARVAELEANIK